MTDMFAQMLEDLTISSGRKEAEESYVLVGFTRQAAPAENREWKSQNWKAAVQPTQQENNYAINSGNYSEST